MSSRNQHLSSTAKLTAAKLYETLIEASGSIKDRKIGFASIQREAEKRLIGYGFFVDYISIRSSIDLSIPDKDTKKLIILASVIIEDVRLIDNIIIG
jgi:pantoate--beta-alanine ligase